MKEIVQLIEAVEKVVADLKYIESWPEEIWPEEQDEEEQYDVYNHIKKAKVSAALWKVYSLWTSKEYNNLEAVLKSLD